MMKKEILLIMGIIPMVYGKKFISHDGGQYDADKLMESIDNAHEWHLLYSGVKEPTVRTFPISTSPTYDDFREKYEWIVGIYHQHRNRLNHLQTERFDKLTQDSLATFLIPMPMICQIRNHLFKEEKSKDIILILIKIWIERNVKTEHYTSKRVFLGVNTSKDKDYTLENYIDDQLNKRYCIFSICFILFLCIVFYTQYYITSLIVFCIYIALVQYVNKTYGYN